MAETPQELREHALMMANNTYEPPSAVIERAEEYLKFLTKGEGWNGVKEVPALP